MHRFIHVKNKTLPLTITMVDTPLRARAFARRRKIVTEPWPCLRFTDWMKLTFGEPQYNGFFFLAGHSLDRMSVAEGILERFWDRYKFVDPVVMPKDPKRTLPVYIHGDEGRGSVKRPIMIISVQPAISAKGEDTINSHGCLICTNIFYSCSVIFTLIMI